MNIKELEQSLQRYEAIEAQLSTRDRMAAAQMLMRATSNSILNLRSELSEDDAASNRRTAKRRETGADPKQPVKPVRVSEPTKPKKPKYSGNHAPSARGR